VLLSWLFVTKPVNADDLRAQFEDGRNSPVIGCFIDKYGVSVCPRNGDANEPLWPARNLPIPAPATIITHVPCRSVT